MPKINDATQVYTSENGFVTIWSYDSLTDTYTPGEKIAVQDFLSTASLNSSGITNWQALLKQAIATDSLRDISGANVYTQTNDNGVYITSATSTNLPDTNLVGTLEVYNSGTTKYLRYQTFNSGRIEIWTNYFNGTDWGGWDLANIAASLSFENGLTEDTGVVGIGGSLTDDTELDFDGNVATITGDDSELNIEFLNTGTGISSSLIIGSNIVLAIGDYSVVIESTGISLSNPPKIEAIGTPPGNDASVVTSSTTYLTDASTTNLPSTTLIGILETFYTDSNNAMLRYTTYTSGQIEIWGRKKTSGTWTDWTQITSGDEGTLDHAALTSNLPFTDSGHTGTANTIAAFDGSGDATELGNIFAVGIALSQKDTDIEADTAIADFNIPEDGTLIGYFITVSVAPIGSSAIFDVNLTGTGTILSTKITIESGEYSSLDATTQPVLSTTSVTKGQYGTVDCDQTGATVKPQNAILVILYRK